MKPPLWSIISVCLLLLACQAAVEILPSATATATSTLVLPSPPSTLTPSPTVTSTALSKSEAQTPTTSPTLESGWNIYRNDSYGFELQYPVGGNLSVNMPDYARIDLPFLLGTNLEEKFLEIHAQPGGGLCQSPLAQNLPPDILEPEELLINHLEYTVIKGSEGAAGSRYEWVSYSIQNEDTCVNLDFVLHSSVPENYPTPPPLYDAEIESRVFAEIAATFVWLAP